LGSIRWKDTRTVATPKQSDLLFLDGIVDPMINAILFPSLCRLTDVSSFQFLQDVHVKGTADRQSAEAANRIHRSVLIPLVDAVSFQTQRVAHKVAPA
jgi:hypothetical protein